MYSCPIQCVKRGSQMGNQVEGLSCASVPVAIHRELLPKGSRGWYGCREMTANPTSLSSIQQRRATQAVVEWYFRWHFRSD